MKYVSMLAGMFLVFSCQDNEVAKSDLTGKQTTYALKAGSVYNINGTVTFQETKDGATRVVIELSGTESGGIHPVHLHLGDLAEADADIAALLTPVAGSSGESVTTLTALSDETSITYQQLVALHACVKIHLAEAGEGRDIILAGGNIGEAAQQEAAGRVSSIISVCKSE